MNANPNQETVMVVDDTPANLQLLDGILRTQGYRVSAFPRGGLALKAAMKNPPDIVLLDINMPEMNGFEVCRRLKENNALKDIPVIFISAMGETEDKLTAFSTGGVDYVTKPFQVEEVCARIETHLRIRRMSLELKRHNSNLEKLVIEKAHEITESQMATIFALAKLAESRDEDTGHHIERTRIFCKMLALKLRENPRYKESIDEPFIDVIFQSAPLHDIGKVAIPDAILLKPGKLDPSELEIMKTHSLIGARTLEAVRGQYPRNNFLEIGISIARSHHEKWDGGGYPDGLAGYDIPIAARIMALADVYDALRSKRPYKDPFPHEKTCRIIEENTGRHFDPSLVEAFIVLHSEFAEIRDRMRDE